MNHADHVALIASGVTSPGGTWADLGAGDGAFTLALRDCGGAMIEIHAVDNSVAALANLVPAINSHFPGTKLITHRADFTQPLRLPPLDGILAANALHFVEHRWQAATIGQWRRYLKPGGRIILVEYDTEEGNRWVPYPISFLQFASLASDAGFSTPVLIDARPSQFLGSIYGAYATLPVATGIT